LGQGDVDRVWVGDGEWGWPPEIPEPMLR
jgi:hypothetical protein